MAIPRVIHQTVRNKSKLHPVLKENIAFLRRSNPGWQHRLYDDDDIRSFIKQQYPPDVLARYKRINPTYGPARADFFRYLLMYRFGGVYLDAKSSVSRPLDELIEADDAYLLSRWNNRPGHRFHGFGLHAGLGPEGEYQQWHIVAAPGHPYLQAVIARVTRNIDEYELTLQGTGKRGVLRVTGPIPYTEAIVPIVADHPHRIVDAEALGFVYSVTGGPGREMSHINLFPSH